MTSATFKTKVTGHVLIKDRATGEVLVNKKNAIHNKNMAVAIARGLANEPPDLGTGIGTNQIYKLKLGNGGSVVDNTNIITYQQPNVVGTGATLYNETYSEVIDEAQAGTATENSVTYLESAALDETSIVICTATIAAGEPAGQDVTDTEGNPYTESVYAFDELGLFTSDDRMLSHIIFSPILKTANREIVVTYTLTISVS